MEEGDFDHSPALLTVYPRVTDGKKYFKYFIMWRLYDDFNNLISSCWYTEMKGTKMYTLVQKAKHIKRELKGLNKKGFNDIQTTEIKAHRDMATSQAKMHQNPGQPQLTDDEI